MVVVSFTHFILVSPPWFMNLSLFSDFHIQSCFLPFWLPVPPSVAPVPIFSPFPVNIPLQLLLFSCLPCQRSSIFLDTFQCSFILWSLHATLSLSLLFLYHYWLPAYQTLSGLKDRFVDLKPVYCVCLWVLVFGWVSIRTVSLYSYHVRS